MLAPGADGGDEEGADEGDSDTSDSTDPSDAESAEGPATEAVSDEIPMGPGFDGKTIKLGFLGLYNERFYAIGNQFEQGQQIYWNWLNSRDGGGGVAGKYQVELERGNILVEPADGVSLSPQELLDPLDPVTDYERLKDDVVMFSFIQSTSATEALLPSLKADKIVAVPGSVAGRWACEALLLPSGSAYEYEMINLADWYANESGLATSNDVHCSAYTNDLYGEYATQGLEYALGKLNLTLKEEHQQPVARYGSNDYPAIIKKLQDAGCTVVYAMTLAEAQDNLLAAAKEADFEPYWLGAYPSYLNAIARNAAENYEKFYVTIDGPALVSDPDDTDVPGMKRFAERFAQYPDGTVPTTYQLGGYFQAIAVHELLEKAVELGDLSRKGMVNAMAQLGEVDTDGLTAENYFYGLPEDRDPTSGTRIFKFNHAITPDHLEEVAEIDSQYNRDFSFLQPAGSSGDSSEGSPEDS